MRCHPLFWAFSSFFSMKLNWYLPQCGTGPRVFLIFVDYCWKAFCWWCCSYAFICQVPCFELCFVVALLCLSPVLVLQWVLGPVGADDKGLINIPGSFKFKTANEPMAHPTNGSHHKDNREYSKQPPNLSDQIETVSNLAHPSQNSNDAASFLQLHAALVQGRSSFVFEFSLKPRRRHCRAAKLTF